MKLGSLIIFLSLSLLFGNDDCIAQNIEINTQRVKETYQIGSTILKQKEVKQRISSDRVDLDKFVCGRGWNIGGLATCGAGGVILLSGVGLAIDNSVKNEVLSASEKMDESLSWTLIGVGVGALIPGAIMMLHGRNQRVNGVKKFNQTVEGSAKAPILIRPSSRGIGLTLVF